MADKQTEERTVTEWDKINAVLSATPEDDPDIDDKYGICDLIESQLEGKPMSASVGIDLTARQSEIVAEAEQEVGT